MLKPTTTEQPVEQMVTEPVVQEQVVSAEDLIKEAEEVKQQITQQVVETPEKQMQEESVTIDGVTIICRPWEKKKYIVRVPCYQKHILRSFEEFQMAQRFAAKVAEMLGIPLRYLVIDLVPNYVPEPSWEMYEEMLRKIEDILATGSVELVCGLQPRVATATTETTPELAPPPGYFIA
ncbi:MAG: hypothetical protein DRO14_04705 [Thermoprotei archaeon]|nr:MAG: hypothetical protein DRO14_04705 [Thermoprotei archaeon]